jgi:outer membrane lipoprotein-sorting protein
VSAQLTPRSYKLIRKEDGGSPEAIQYIVRPPEGGRIVSTVWLDLKARLPLKATHVILGGGRQVTVTEEYFDLKLNEEIEPARFKLP